jgi:hypothetical protein
MASETLFDVAKSLLRAIRYAASAFAAFALWFLAREIWDLVRFFFGIHPAAGSAFLVALAAFLYVAVARPAIAFLRVPAAVRPPDVPSGEGEAAPRIDHVEARGRGVMRYLDALERNPSLDEARRGLVRKALEDGARLLEALPSAPREALEALARFEHERVEPLLAPLDDQARRLIRNEALAVAVATAVSPVAAADGLFVLWRNATLVLRLARLYYGRPGALGSLLVLRDVTIAVWVAWQMQGVVGAGASAAGGFLGRAAAPLAGPIADGAVNGLATLRIGYLARARCRAFRAFTRATLASVLQSAFREATMQGVGLVSDLVRTVGRPVLRIPEEIARRLLDWVKGLVGREPAAEPEGKPETA